MKYEVKQNLKNFTKNFGAFFNNIGKTIASCLKIIVFSSLKVSFKSKRYPELKTQKSCCVLGNGPSLKVDLDESRVPFESNDIFCVNLFCLSPYFTVIKPRFYLIADPMLFYPTNERAKEKTKILIEALQKVDWPMFFIIPSSCDMRGDVVNSINNNNITYLKINTTYIDGFKGFRHYLYKKRMGMPRCQTVVNMAITFCINMGYENVYLYGVDHTWTKDLRVNDKNEVCYGDRHVYNTNLTTTTKDYNIAFLLTAFARMFSSHYSIEQYARSRKVKVWNCAKESFVDAYERLIN